MREMTVSKNDAGQRLDRFLTKAVPGLPATLAQKYIRTKRIKVGGKRAEQDYRLMEGDTIQLYISDPFFEPAAKAEALYRAIPRPVLTIRYEDAQILIVDKPTGLLCHSDSTEGEPTLIDQIKAHLYQSGQWDPEREQSFVPALCNRLDRNTGGLVLAAKTAAALQELNQKIRDREVDKYYLLAVHGRPEPPAGRLEGYLQKDRPQNRVRLTHAETEEAKAAVTLYQTIESKGGLSLVECRLETGRTHQIRAHLAHIGHPIIGDGKYCPNYINKQYSAKMQRLWAYKLEFRPSL